MKSVYVKSVRYIDFGIEIIKMIKIFKFKVGEHVRITKYKNIFAKRYFPNLREIEDLNGEEIVGAFYKKELQKSRQTEFRVEKVIETKDDKPYIKWIILLTVALMKNIFLYKITYFIWNRLYSS